MVAYLKAIKKPFVDLKKSGLAALLVWIPIVNFLSYGYFLECAKKSIENKKELPEWTNFGDKFIRGFLFLVIKIAYMIPLFLVSIIFLRKFWKSLFDKSFFQVLETSNMVGVSPKIIDTLLQPSFVGIFIFIIALSILINYFIPLASVFYVVNWGFKDAFKFGEIVKKALTKEYFFAWVFVTIYSILLFSVGSFMPFIGGIIATTLTGITSFSIFGSVYNEIR